jgi:hypothetical protein
MMMEAGVAITDLGKLSNREERFYSRIAEKYIPGVKLSARAYVAFLDKTRADVFDHLLLRFKAQGVDVMDTEFLKGLGTYINWSTGRGEMLHVGQEAANVLNTVFFSPRLMKSRFDFFNPAFYIRLPAPVRKEALRAAFQTAGTVSFVLGLGAAAGAKVGHDPRNADFAKIRIGNTRVDVAAGHQQWLRLYTQLATSTIISSTTGKRYTLAGGYGQTSRKDILQRFFEGKFSPPASFINDAFKGTDFQGAPFEVKKALVERMIPLLAQDAKDLYDEKDGGVDGITAAFLGYGVGMWGVGIQTYGSRPSSSSGKPGGRPRLSRRPGSGRSLSPRPGSRASNRP